MGLSIKQNTLSNFFNFKIRTHCMERKYKITIPEPWEDWNKMTPNDQGRFV
jgi:hypothetical protein